MKNEINIIDLFNNAKTYQTYVKVCAPMVRYSKVHFRTLVKQYGANLCFTPMIMADSFCQNEKARNSEFSTTVNDTPLIVQFAANNPDDFVDATKLVQQYADGVDLNCGCPQRWAMKDGYGCALLFKPDLIHDLVRSIKSNLPNDFSVSVKIRILKDLRKTIEMCQQLEKCGVSFLTVHGRTPAQKSTGTVDLMALRDVCESVRIPIIANGGVKSLTGADEMYEITKCNGVMVASALLTNPALFSGADVTPISCVKEWTQLKDIDKDKISFQCYHHHLVFMLEKILNREQKVVFNSLYTFESVDAFLAEFILNNDTNDNNLDALALGDFVECQFDEEITIKHAKKCRGCGKSSCYCICNKYDCNTTDGNFFTSYVKESDALDYMDSNIFDEI